WSKRYFAQIIVIAHAGHHKILAFCSGFGSWRCLAAMLLDPLPGLGGCAVVDGHLVTTFVLQVSRHRVAHDTQTQKRHLRHQDLLRLSWPADSRSLSANRSLPGRVRQPSRPNRLTGPSPSIW